jgi:hypothetical protein
LAADSLKSFASPVEKMARFVTLLDTYGLQDQWRLALAHYLQQTPSSSLKAALESIQATSNLTVSEAIDVLLTLGFGLPEPIDYLARLTGIPKSSQKAVLLKDFSQVAPDGLKCTDPQVVELFIARMVIRAYSSPS